MKKYIVSYLTENYYLDKSEIGNAGIYAFDDDRRFKVPSNAKKLIEEIVTLFGYSFTRTKWLIHDWAYKQKPDYCLKFYWKSHEIDGDELDHPTPNYMLAVDPANNDPHIAIAKVRNPDRNEIIRKWQASGLLDNFDGSKPSIASLYESQTRQLL
jgi:hypothetical protein